MRDVGYKMIYNNPRYQSLIRRKTDINSELLHNMYKYTKSLKDTLPSIGMK